MTLGTGFLETDDLAGTRGKPPGVAAFILPERILCANCAVETGAVPEAAIDDPEAQPDDAYCVLRQQHSGPAQIQPGDTCDECEKVIQVNGAVDMFGNVREEVR